MKKTIRLLGLLLMLAMLATLCACGAPKKEDAVVGTWRASWDCTEYFCNEVDEKAGIVEDTGLSVSDYITEPLKLDLILELGADRSAKFYSAQDSIEPLYNRMRPQIENYYKDILVAAIKTGLSQKGIDIPELNSVEDLEKALNMTLDEIMLNGFGTDFNGFMEENFSLQMFRDSLDVGKMTGSYRAVGKALQLTLDDVGDIPFDLVGDTLTLADGADADDPLFPLDFKRVG